MTPGIAFLESVGPMLVATRHRRFREQWVLKFVLKSNARFISPALRARGPVVCVGEQTMRWLRMAAGLALFPIIQQSSLSASYRLNLWKTLISDGLLTEYIVNRMGERPTRFYSMHDVVSDASALVDSTAIIGSNWMEFGAMSPAAYEAHLRFLKTRYPEATYFCHPKERSSAPEDVFGQENVRRPDEPVEAHLLRTGLPARLVGVCSSAMLSIPSGNTAHVAVDLVQIPPTAFDGDGGDVVQRFTPPLRGVSEVRVTALQDYLHDALIDMGVPVQRVPQP